MPEATWQGSGMSVLARRLPGLGCSPPEHLECVGAGARCTSGRTLRWLQPGAGGGVVRVEQFDPLRWSLWLLLLHELQACRKDRSSGQAARLAWAATGVVLRLQHENQALQ